MTLTPPPGEDRRPELRIGTAEREVTIARLQAALSEGRLDIAEFDERLGAVYQARTAGELAPLTADLPAPATAARSAPPARDEARRAERDRHRDRRSGAWLTYAWRTWAAAVAINIVIWLIVSVGNGFDTYFWPMWVAGPWGAILLINTIFYRAGGSSRD